MLLFSYTTAYSQVDIPDAPRFLSASVTPGVLPGEVTLKWNPSDSADVAGYIIYQVVGSTSVTIDTVRGRLSKQYINVNSQASVQTETYRIAAFDTLLYKSMITDPHTTMIISSDYERCEQSVTLSWSEYVGFSEGVNAYRLFRRANDTQYSSVAVLEDTILEYRDENLIPGKTYCYYVEALDSDGNSSTSNETCIYLDGFASPAYLIASSTVVEGDALLLGFTVDTAAEVSQYKLLRSDQIDGNFSIIETQPANGLGTVNFIDNNIDVNSTVFYYKLASFDPCGKLSGYSNICCNIVASVDGNNTLEHYISWTPYRDFINSVDIYTINASYGNSSAFNVGQTDLNNLDFHYNIEYYINLMHAQQKTITNRYCYYIEAFENVGNGPVIVQGYSKSNLACTTHAPVFYMPTAFCPGSFIEENRVFRPVMSFIENGSYEFTVYSKWGLTLFQTNDPFEAWDGYIDTMRAPENTYLYKVAYKDANGNEINHIGSFVLHYD